MVAEEYEILPHKLLEDLRDDVEALRNRLAAPDQASNELILEIESLKDSIHDLHTVFSQALSEVKEDDSASRLAKLESQLDSVVLQNQTIAKGMLAISDKLDAFIRLQHQSAAQAPAPVARPQMQARSSMPPASFGKAAPSSGMGAARPMAPRPPLPEFGTIPSPNARQMNSSNSVPPSPMGMPPAPPPSPRVAKKKHGLFGR